MCKDDITKQKGMFVIQGLNIASESWDSGKAVSDFQCLPAIVSLPSGMFE